MTSLRRLIVEIEEKTPRRAVASASPAWAMRPRQVVRRLAQDDDISVAGPVLRHSRAARRLRHSRYRQEQEPGPSPGDRQPPRHRRGGHRRGPAPRRPRRAACISPAITAPACRPTASPTLIKRAEHDGILADKVGQRPDISPRHAPRAPVAGDRRGAETAPRQRQAGDQGRDQAHVLTQVSKEVGTKTPRARLSPAPSTPCSKLHRGGQLDQAAIAGRSPPAAATRRWWRRLSLMSKVPLDVVERLMGGERPDPVLIL